MRDMPDIVPCHIVDGVDGAWYMALGCPAGNASHMADLQHNNSMFSGGAGPRDTC